MSDGKVIAGKPAQTLVEIATGLDLGKLALSAEEGFVLSRVGTGMPLADLAAASGVDPAKADKLIGNLLAKGALKIRGGSASARPPSPGGLDQTLDLTPERQREILDLDAKVAGASHFEILGVPDGATPEQCKSAYYELSMRLHPDRFFGKNLGAFRPRIERIFRRLTEAQQVLTDREKRAEYEKAHPELFRVAPRANGAAAANDFVHDSLRAEDRARRIARHPYLAKVARSHELLGRARKALAANQPAPAILDLEQLLKLEPNNAEAKRLLQEANQKRESVRGNQAMEEGLRLVGMGDTAVGLRHLMEALERAPTKELCPKGYTVALEAGDLKTAKAFAQKWVEFEPRSVKARLALAEVMERMGLVKNARREAEEAVKLDPDNKQAKALFARLKWT